MEFGNFTTDLDCFKNSFKARLISVDLLMIFGIKTFLLTKICIREWLNFDSIKIIRVLLKNKLLFICMVQVSGFEGIKNFV